MNSWLYINSAMEIWGILFCLSIITFTRFANLNAKENRNMVQLFACLILLMASSLIGGVLQGSQGSFVHLILWISYYLYFALTYIVIFAFIRLILNSYFPEAGENQSYKQMMENLKRAAQIMLVLVTISLFNHIFFRISPDNEYHRGPLFPIYQAYAAAMVGYALVWVLRQDNEMSDKAVKRGITDGVILAFGIVIQYLLPQYEIINIVLLVLATECFLNIMVDHIQEMSRKEKELELQRTINKAQQSEIMISQIQPHFLYNTLNSIYYLCDQDPELAKEAISEFSEYLRGNLKSFNKNEPIPIDEEMEHVRNYLWLEKLRFEERLNVEWDIRCHSFSVPALSVQPLVENAVKHGICKKPEGGTISIRTREHADRYEVIVKDDGVGFQAENYKNLRNVIPAEAEDNAPENRHTFIGIENVRSRIHAMSGGNLFLDSEPGKGTIVVLTIRKKSEEIDENTDR